MSTYLYNPDRKSKTELISEFAIRTDIYEEIMRDLESSPMSNPEQHYLLVGQRGAGKTTMLLRIKYGIDDSAKINRTVVPILFNEEQYNISELVNLWENVAQYLEDYQGFENLSQEIELNSSKKDFEELSFDIITNYLKRRNKKLVLLIDNIGDLLKKLNKIEIHRLREILQTSNDLRLIVASPFYLETLLNYHQPFFEFFKVIHLDGLDQTQTHQLLLKLAEMEGQQDKIEKIIRETPERIETLRTLTGGVPRTIVLMFNIFVEYNNDDTIHDLEKILDAVTPLYKHRMDDLPTQQQKIVDAVAKNWDGISVKELVGKTRLESKIISAQLRQLQKNKVIETVSTNTKNNIYFLRERFFNIWYLMRYGRKYERQRVIWLVKFLESWCNIIEIEQRVFDFAKKVKGGELNEDSIDFFGQVYAGMKNLDSKTKFILMEATPTYISTRIKIEDTELLQMAEDEHANGNFRKAVSLFQQIKNPSIQSTERIIVFIYEIIAKGWKYYEEVYKSILQRFANNLETFFDKIFILQTLNHTTLRQLMANEFEKAHASLNVMTKVLDDGFGLPDSCLPPIINETFVQFLAFEQYHIVLAMFEKFPVLKDKVKPLYFTTLSLSGHQEESIKMGPEIKPQVEHTIRFVQNWINRRKSTVKN